MAESFVARLRELDAEATDAPWTVGPDDDKPGIVAELGPVIIDCDTDFPDGADGWDEESSTADAALIVALRNKAPDLIALIEAAEALCESAVFGDGVIAPQGVALSPPRPSTMTALFAALAAVNSGEATT